MVNCPSKPLKQGGITVNIFFVRGRNFPFKLGKGTFKSRIQQTLNLLTEMRILSPLPGREEKKSWEKSNFFSLFCSPNIFLRGFNIFLAVQHFFKGVPKKIGGRSIFFYIFFEGVQFFPVWSPTLII